MSIVMILTIKNEIKSNYILKKSVNNEQNKIISKNYKILF